MTLPRWNHLFDDLTVRKPCRWEEVPKVSLEYTDPDGGEVGADKEVLVALRRAALQCMPHTYVPWDSSPYEDIFNPRDSREGRPIEHIVERLGGPELQYFYVNTDGFTYARYAFQIDLEELARLGGDQK